MKLLERRLTIYEEKYGVLSEDFYAVPINRQESAQTRNFNHDEGEIE